MKKKEILEKCKSILNKYEIGEYIYWNDFDFMTDVFSKHEEWELKRGSGLSGISIIKDTFGGRCFCLHRTDGSNTDISYKKSVYSNTKISDIKKACRSAIRGEIVTFRNNNVIYDDSKCAITYETLTKGNVHIDHYDLTFASMFKLWIADKEIDFLHSKINKTTDNSFETFFTDLTIIEDFINFHNKHSKLRAVTADANIMILRNKKMTQIHFTATFDDSVNNYHGMRQYEKAGIGHILDNVGLLIKQMKKLFIEKCHSWDKDSSKINSFNIYYYDLEGKEINIFNWKK